MNSLIADPAYLLPEEIIDFGISTADEPRPEMVRLMQYTLGYKHPGSARSLARNPNKEQNGTGERGPVHRYETLVRLFVQHNLAAAILLRERAHYFFEVIMDDSASRKDKPFDAAEAANDIARLSAELSRATLAGEPTEKVLAQIQAAAAVHLRRKTNDRARASVQAKKANQVNWRTGQRGL